MIKRFIFLQSGYFSLLPQNNSRILMNRKQLKNNLDQIYNLKRIHFNNLMQTKQINQKPLKQNNKKQEKQKNNSLTNNLTSFKAQQIEHEGKERKQQQKNPNILMKIPEANIIVYQDRIKYIPQQTKIKQVQSSSNNVSISNLQTNFSIGDISLQKQIFFSNSNLTFKYVQDKNYFKIMNYGANSKQKINLEFKVNDKQDRHTLHQIFKKKMCEVGFQDQFQIIKQIGKGATSKVYLAIRKSDQRYFAAKIISLTSSEEKTYVKSQIIKNTFINQNRILKALKSPNIVYLEGLYISHKKELISVLQYLAGGSLLQQLRQVHICLKKRKIITKKQKFKAIKDITLGIQHMRQKRIVHRDLKLQNIMIRINPDKTKDYVVTDMGLSNWIGEKNILYQKCGTPGYIAPQVLSTQKGSCLLSHSNDVFSLGVLFHYILLLEPLFPYNGDTKQLLRLNKIAAVNLYTKKYHCLTREEFSLLKVTLELDSQKRVSSKNLLQLYIPNYQKQIIQSAKSKRQNLHINLQLKKNSSKKKGSQQKLQKVSVNCKSQRSIQIIGQKNVSMTKKQININSLRQLKLISKPDQSKHNKSSSIDNAKKIVNRVIQKINFFSKSKDKKDNSANSKPECKSKNQQADRHELKMKDVSRSKNEMRSFLDD